MKFIDIQDYKGLSKEMYILFIVRIITAMGSNLIYPILVLFLTDKLGYSTSYAGFLYLILGIASIPGSILGGILSDKWSRKNTVFLFSVLGGVFFILAGVFNNYFYLTPVIIILANVMNGVIMPANTAMVGDLTNSENRKTAFSLLYLGHNIGFAIGPAIGGLLFENHISLLFIGAGLTAFVSANLIRVFMKDDKNHINRDDVSKKDDKKELYEESSIKLIWNNKKLLYFALISTLISFILAQNNFTLPEQVGDVIENGAKHYGLLMTLSAFVIIFFTSVITSITKELKASISIAFTGLFCALGYGILYFANNFGIFIISTIIWTIGEILYSTNSNVYIMENTPESHRGRFYSILPLLTGTGYAISPLIMGRYIDAFSIQSAWVIVSLVGLAVFVGMLILYRKESSQELNNEVDKQ